VDDCADSTVSAGVLAVSAAHAGTRRRRRLRSKEVEAEEEERVVMMGCS
jgi:hypothetical protein